MTKPLSLFFGSIIHIRFPVNSDKWHVTFFDLSLNRPKHQKVIRYWIKYFLHNHEDLVKYLQTPSFQEGAGGGEIKAGRGRGKKNPSPSGEGLV
jgi:hypothetical protein